MRISLQYCILHMSCAITMAVVSVVVSLMSQFSGLLSDEIPIDCFALSLFIAMHYYCIQYK